MTSMQQVACIIALGMSLSFGQFAVADEAEYEAALSAMYANDYDKAHIHVRNVLKASPSHLPAQVLYGDILLAMGYPKEAQNVLQQAYEQGADELSIIPKIATTLLQQQQPEQALSLITAAKAATQQSADVVIITAQSHAAMNAPQKAIEMLTTLVAKQPRHVDAAVSLANLYLAQYQLTDAAAVLTHLEAHARPAQLNKLDYWSVKGHLAQAQLAHTDALTFFSRAVAVDSENSPALQALAQTQLHLGQITAAQESIALALTITPNTPSALYVQSQIQRAQQQDEAAEKTLDAINHYISMLDEQTLSTQPQWMLFDAMASYAKANYALAIDKLKRYLAQQPQDLNAVMMLARAQRDDNKVGAAISTLQAHQGMLQQHAQYGLMLPQLLIEQGRMDEAVKPINYHRLKFPNDSHGHLLNAQWHYLHGDRAKAEQAVGQAAEHSPQVAVSYAQWLVNEAQQQIRAGDKAKAFATYQASLALVSADIPSLYAFSALGRDIGRAAEVEAYLQAQIARYPTRGFLYEILSEHALEMKDYPKTVLYYGRFLQRPAPPIKQAIALNNLAYAYTHLGQYQLAIEHAKQAIALREDIPTFYDTLGVALTKAGRVDEGAAQVAKAVAMAGEK